MLSVQLLNSNHFNATKIQFSTFSVYGWVFKNLMWQTLLCYECEKFYTAVDNVKDTCSFVMNVNCPEDQRKLCKNVMRLLRASFSKISACGLFNIDAALHVAHVTLLTNHVIILLQFTFL
ncbi:hypothetical protein HF086_006418 [Spodoptera exigua]|uniref:Uncharacterized protein n=1 Tax=Spodoptera exigua TaxID=7107 RepID=A0A922SNN6_SPOEX|nr:hypothetical protein HF086_006418 [Spodoptera exigua]